MTGGSVRAALMCGAAVAAACLLGNAAYADDLTVKAPLSSSPGTDFWTSPYLFGDAGRTWLKEQGIDLSLGLVDEAVHNLSGGTVTNSAQAGQLNFGAKFDLNKLVGLQGGLIGLTMVDRFGQNLNTVSDIPALMLTNEVFGRGDILRMTEFYYSQTLANNQLELKGGRLPVGSDFFFQLCEFVNLTFCGGQPGNVQGGYIFNFPVSQWGGVAHLHLTNQLTISVGAYDANPNYLTTSDASIYALPGIPSSNPASGVLVPVELTFKPNWGAYNGAWRLGGWYDDASSIDGGMPGIVTTIPSVGGVPAQSLGDQRGRYGFYESIYQRVTAEGSGPQGWYAFLNTTIADHRTAFEDYQVAGGVKHWGTFDSRPDDEVGFAVGTTHVNSAALSPNAGGNEVPFEAWYGLQATGWMNLKFDLQYVVDPGGRGFNADGVKTDNAWVIGMRTTVHF